MITAHTPARKELKFVSDRGLCLAGHLYRPERKDDRVVVLAHGFTSEKTSRGKFVAAAHALAIAGISSLAFDFAGCGESQDDTLTLNGQIDDLLSAMQFTSALGFRRLAILGSSLGSLIALRAYAIATGTTNAALKNPPRVEAIALWGAVLGPIHYDWNGYFSLAQLAELETTGKVAIPRDHGKRQAVIVDKSLLDEFQRVDTASLVQPLRCPVLFVHGDGDCEERELLKNSRAALAFLPLESRIEVLAGAPHGFGDAIPRAVELTKEWLVQHFS